MSVISLQTVKEAVEQNIDLKVVGVGSTLALLRELQKEGALNKQQTRELGELERGIDLSAQTLFKTLSAAFGSGAEFLDQSAIRARFENLSVTTQHRLIEKMYPQESAQMRRDLAGADHLRAGVISRLSDGFSGIAADSTELVELLKVLALDPACAHIKQFLASALELIDELVDSAKGLLKDSARRRVSVPKGSLVDDVSYQSSRIENDHELGVHSRNREKKHGAEKSAAQEELGAIVKHSAVERALRELQVKLLALNNKIDQARGAIAGTPADKSFEDGIKLHQDERDADSLKGRIADLERDALGV